MDHSQGQDGNVKYVESLKLWNWQGGMRERGGEEVKKIWLKKSNNQENTGGWSDSTLSLIFISQDISKELWSCHDFHDDDVLIKLIKVLKNRKTQFLWVCLI